MSPYEAYEEYGKAQRAAAAAYLAYWVAKFDAAGIKFVVGDPAYYSHWYDLIRTDFNGYLIEAYVRPAHFDGIKIRIKLAASPRFNFEHWREVKVKSDSGFAKLLRNLQQKTFV